MAETKNDLVQIIDENGEIIEAATFNELVSKWGLLEKGFEYYVVAILGAQSGGKSTLLNLLFGTSFLTLEAQRGRVQVTKGIWMGHANTQSDKKESLLIMDVEGVDGRERGEKEQNFERKTSLFSLALSEVLIVNMWHTDVGRYNAGNISLLKTVFEQHLLLFGKTRSKKSLILFVIRDHLAQETPLSQLQNIIMQSMTEIWESITKSASLKDYARTQVSDCFEFQFVGLPHKVLKADEFNSSIDALRRRFLDSKTNDYIFAHVTPRDVPADGFAPFSSRIWQTIRENKDLDLPSQKEMLAMFRCNEISESIKAQFTQQITPIKSALDKGLIDEFGRKISEIYNQCLTQYDGPASRYHHDVAQKIRGSLASTMSMELFAMYTRQIHQLAEKTVKFFNKLVVEGLPNDGTSCRDFANVIKTIENSTYEYFETRAKASLLSGSDWEYKTDFEEIRQQIQKEIVKIRESELKKLMDEMKALISSAIQKPLDKLFETNPSDTWVQVRKIFEGAKEKALGNLQDRLKGFQVEAHEETKLLDELKTVAFEALKDRFKSKAKMIDYLLSKKFEEHFNLDDKGLPRRWHQSDDVKKYFLDARSKAMFVLENYSFLRMEPSHDSIKYLDGSDTIDDALVIMSYEECTQAKDKFERDTNTAYLQALRDQEHVASTAQIPMYIVLMVLVLGFNEFIYILTSPLLLLLAIVVGAGGYVLYMLNMMGPAKKVMEALLHTSLATLQQWISDQMMKPKHPEHGNAHNANNSTDGKTKTD